MATGVALMSGGVAAMKNGVAIAAAGASTCCCGLTPCGCVQSPDCRSVASQEGGQYSVRRDVFLGPLIYEFGPSDLPCCCHDNEEQVWDWFYQGDLYWTDGECVGTIQDRGIITGGGSGSSSSQLPWLWRKFLGDSHVPCALEELPPQSGVSSPGACVAGAPLEGAFVSLSEMIEQPNVVGWVRRTCNVWEGDVKRYTQSLKLELHVRFRHTLSANRVGCVTPTCRTCCLPDGTCILADPDHCDAKGGISGTGSDCSAFPCGVEIGFGACCQSDGSCRQTLASRCTGVFNPGVLCSEITCPVNTITAACCRENGTCDEMTLAMCTSTGGFWHPGEHCVSFICPLLQGACCLQSGAGAVCQVMTSSQCATNNGIFRGIGTDCNGLNACLGACCQPNPNSPTGFTCAEPNGEAFCISIGGRWLGYFPVVCGQDPDPRCTQSGHITQPPSVRGTRGFFLDGHLRLLRQRATRRRPDPPRPRPDVPLVHLRRARRGVLAGNRGCLHRQRTVHREAYRLMRTDLPQGKAPGGRHDQVVGHPVVRVSRPVAVVLHVQRPDPGVWVHGLGQDVVAEDSA